MRIIARVPASRLPKPPADVRQMAATMPLGSVYDREADVLGESYWVVGRWVHPHIDSELCDFMLITLCVDGEFWFGDAKAVTGTVLERYAIHAGSMFLVDPRVPHWAYPLDVSTPSPFILLQWRAPRRTARHKARRLCEEFGASLGEWATSYSRRLRKRVHELEAERKAMLDRWTEYYPGGTYIVKFSVPSDSAAEGAIDTAQRLGYALVGKFRDGTFYVYAVRVE